MKLKSFVSVKILIVFLIVFSKNNEVIAANITTAATGAVSASSTWPNTARTGSITSTTSSKIVTGTGTLFLTEFNIGSRVVNSLNAVVGVVASIQSNTQLTLVSNAANSNTNSSYKINGIGPVDALFIAAGQAITVDINFRCASITFNTSASLQNSLTLQTNDSLIVTGAITMPQPSTTGFNCILNINDGYASCGSYTMNATTNGRDDVINITTGKLIISGNFTSGTTGCKVNITGAGSLSLGGTVGTFTLTNTGNSTVIYAGAAQTVRPITYFNLTLGGSGTKIITGVTVNGTLTFESTATIGTVISYGTTAALKYNTSTSRTVTSNEWPATFLATGGVIISSTGAITINETKTFSSSVNLTIENGATLSTANLTLSFNANFINSGTLNAGSSNIIITGTLTNQSIGSITTTGTITMSKSSGSAQFTGGINAKTLAVNGTNASLSLKNHSHFIGTLNLIAGTLIADNSITSITANITKTSGIFNPSTSLIYINGSGAQTIAVDTFYNLILSGSGVKTSTAGTLNVGNNLTTMGSASYTSVPFLEVYGNLDILENSSITIGSTYLTLIGNLTIGDGGVSTFTISSAAGSKSISGDFILNSNAIFNNSGNEIVEIGGDVKVYGTATWGTAAYILKGNLKNINSTNPLTIPSITVNGTYTNNTNLTVTSALTGTGSLTNNIAATLNLATNTISISELVANALDNTVNYTLLGAQTIYPINYYNLSLSGSGIKTFQNNTNTILGKLILNDLASTSFFKGITIYNELTVNNGSTFNGGPFSHTFFYNIKINSGGIANWTGTTIILDGSKQNYTDNNTTKYAINNLTLTGQGLKTITVSSILGNVIVNDNDSLLLNNVTFTIAGTTTVGNGSSGYLSLQNNSGSKVFTGDVIFNSNAIFDNSNHTNVSFAGNTTFNGSFISGGGTYTYTGSNKIISGTTNISLINLAMNGNTRYSGTGSLNISGLLSGSGKLTNSGIIYISTNTPIAISQLNASSSPNTIHYTGGTQTIYGTNYYNLSLSGSGTKNMANSTDSIIGNLSISSSVTFNPTDNLVILGNLSTTGSSSISFGLFSYKIAGNISFGSGTTFNTSTATFTLNGTNQSFSNSTLALLTIGNTTLIGGIKTFTNNTTFLGTLNINSDATLKVGTTSTMTFNCLFTGTGKIAGTNCSDLVNRNLSFELASNMGTVYIDQTNNYFGRVSVKNNTSINIENDIQIFEYLDLSNGTITINHTLYFLTSDVPIKRTTGFLNMASTSSLIFGGCNSLGANFTIPTNTFITPPTLVNFMINRTNGVNLGTNTINVSDALFLASGTLQVSPGSLKLISTATKTARVAQISGTANISGNVIVERYIPGGINKRKWRFLSFATNNSGSMPFSQLIDNILITAPAGAAAGFDVNPLNPANTASLRTYTESTTGAASNGWTDPNSINNIVATGVGFEVFIRGSRSLANPYLNWTVPDNVTLNYTGDLNVGDNTVFLSYTNTGNSAADGFNLVGNPYASPINFDTTGWTKTNIQNKFWSYNPNTGLYGIYDAALQTGTNGITKYIASSQGFFVKATAASPSIKFTENVKCINSGNNYFKPNSASQSLFPMLSISISNDSSNTDETILVFDENSSTLSTDEHDASKWFNDALNIYTISSDKYNLNIDSRKWPSHIDSIPLAVYSYNGSNVMTTPHRISINGLHNIPSNVDVVLWDKYLNAYSNLKVNPNYDFTITTENTSWGKNRFIILIGDVNIGINNMENNSGWKVFPNPAQNSLSVTSTSNLIGEDIQYKIIDQSGRVVQETNFNFDTQIKAIDISNLNNGFYFIEISIADKIKRFKFIKN